MKIVSIQLDAFIDQMAHEKNIAVTISDDAKRYLGKV